ncbi:MAG: sugar phosphate isomerase/epimerase, partial [Candidatus Omnitrophica bacterium]|nr:sugar phosphate isomerase/epimerase [Candidatus Omnitrophota bacterium]
MKYSLFTVTFAGFWGQHRLTLEEAIDKTAELGFEGVEIMGKRPHLSPLDYSLEDCKRLRERLDEKGLKLAAIAGYTDFTGGMESAEVPFPEMQIAYVEALAQRAQILGGDLVRIFSSYERPGVAYTAQWQRTVNAIRECADRAG